MKNIYQKQVLILALYAGELMMKSGAEIYRVEDTIERICRACRIDYVECFATTTGITLSLDTAADDSDMHTFIKRIHSTDFNLDRISRINQFSRDFATTGLTVEDGMGQLREIAAMKRLSLPFRLLGAMLVGAALCPVFGGRLQEIGFTAAAACISYAISQAMTSIGFSNFIRIMISCAGSSLFVLLMSLMFKGMWASPAIIGGVAIFLPGVAITNSARDLLSGDMQSGVARFAEAVVIAIALAGGVGIVLKLWSLGGGAYSSDNAVTYPDLFYLLFGIVSTTGFSMLFNAPKKLYPPICLIGSVGMFVFAALKQSGYNIVLASFAGACIISILAEMCSRAGRDATTIFILPGIIPFVPGLSMFKAVEEMLDGNVSTAIEGGTDVLMIAGSIAVAVIVIASVTRLLLALIRRIVKLFGRIKNRAGLQREESHLDEDEGPDSQR